MCLPSLMRALIQLVTDLVHNHFGVGIGGKGETQFALLFAQGLVVFDNAIVDDRDLVAADVWMGITFAGFAVVRPARVRNTGFADYRLPIIGVGQLHDLSVGTNPFQLCAFIQNHQTG